MNQKNKCFLLICSYGSWITSLLEPKLRAYYSLRWLSSHYWLLFEILLLLLWLLLFLRASFLQPAIFVLFPFPAFLVFSKKNYKGLCVLIGRTFWLLLLLLRCNYKMEAAKMLWLLSLFLLINAGACCGVSKSLSAFADYWNFSGSVIRERREEEKWKGKYTFAQLISL